MSEQNYVVANEQGQFYTGTDDDTWSVDKSRAQKFQCFEEAKGAALRENAVVLPQSWLASIGQKASAVA